MKESAAVAAVAIAVVQNSFKFYLLLFVIFANFLLLKVFILLVI